MSERPNLLSRAVEGALANPLLVAVAVGVLVVSGLVVAPFDQELPGIPRDPVPVDAIPDTGDNQQIVFTEWPGRSPQDVEDQVTYPLTVALLGVPGVKSVRSTSMFGFSSIFVIFSDDVEFYWSRSRLLEKLSSLPGGSLPEGVEPTLGPDATSLGQVFWYTLEGRDADGRPAGGFDLEELRTVQDWTVRHALQSVEGVSEVASIGGYQKEYQIDVDPSAMRAHGVTLDQVFAAVQSSNVDVGARTIEINRAEYVVRGLGFLKSARDLEETVVRVQDHTPITIGRIGTVALGPALRRGVLDRGGAEAVGGVVTVRYGANPLQVIERVKAELARLADGLPRKQLSDGTESRVTVVPFYDRSVLIRETLATLSDALLFQILITVVVVLALLSHLRSAALVSGVLPLCVLACFLMMKAFDVDANVVALSGIAIAIGTLVDVGIVVTESCLRHAREPGLTRREACARGTREVTGAVLSAVLTTVVSFLPVFTLEGPEGKLFKPLAFTKTFALLASIGIALFCLPAFVRLWLKRGGEPERPRPASRIASPVLAVLTAIGIALVWEPLGPSRDLANVLATLVLLGVPLFGFLCLHELYEPCLRFCLAHKRAFLVAPALLVGAGLAVWLGTERLFGFVPWAAGRVLGADARTAVVESSPWRAAARTFPGLGQEFMPRLDEGSFLLMPVTMPHASIGEATEMLQLQDTLVAAIPEVRSVVGKIGRVESPLDPAPVSMVETVVDYHPEYLSDESGRPLTFAHDGDEFERDERGLLIPDDDGRAFRVWREHIESPADIWDEIAAAAEIPGMTSASMLQPIETRRVMLQTGLRSTLGVKVRGPDLEALDEAALAIEHWLKQVPAVRPETVLADRLVGKPYLEIAIDRGAIARYGLSVRRIQDVIEVAIGGKRLTSVVDGRERIPVRVRYMSDLRGDVDALRGVLVPAPDGTQIPLGQLADIRYAPGPQSLRSEDGFPVAYVMFDKRADLAEVDVVEACRAFLRERADEGDLVLPAGTSYAFSGNWENQARAQEKLRLVLPLALAIIFVILYLQFRSVLTTAFVFSGVFVAWAGGFCLLWLYAQEGFLDVELLGTNLRDLFHMGPVNLSVAVWVGFLALFGIATDDGVLLATYLDQSFEENRCRTRDEVREAVVRAGLRRVRPCLMTSATTLLALIPVLTATGRGADVMVPMAIPSVGGMLVALITLFVVPTLYCLVRERELGRNPHRS